MSCSLHLRRLHESSKIGSLRATVLSCYNFVTISISYSHLTLPTQDGNMKSTFTRRSFLSTAAVFSLMRQATAFLHDCTEVDYATLQAHLATTGEPARIGTDGLYAPLTSEEISDECLFVGLAPSSAFATEYPVLYSSVVEFAVDSGIFGFEFIPDVSENLQARAALKLEKRQRGCGATCANASCDSCKCKWDHSYCVGGPGPNNCFSIYICK